MTDGVPENEQVIFNVWQDRPIVVRCAGIDTLEADQITIIQDALEKFQIECHHEFIHYLAVQSSLDSLRNRLLQGASEEPLTVAIDQANEDVTALNTRVTWGEAADSFSERGRSRRLPGRSFVVLVYALWETVLRPQIAGTLDVELDDVKSDVMGDWRRLRHWMLYQSERSERRFFRGAEYLAKALNSKEGIPEVTLEGVILLVRCIDSLEIKVDPNGQGFLANPTTPDPETWAAMQQEAEAKGARILPMFPKRPY